MCLTGGEPWACLENILRLGACVLQAYCSTFKLLRLRVQVEAHPPDRMAPNQLLQAWGKVVAEMADIRAANGGPELKHSVAAMRKLLAMKRLSDRRDGSARFRNLVENTSSGNVTVQS